MSVATMIGRRKEPIMGNSPKNDEKNNSGSKWLILEANEYELSTVNSLVVNGANAGTRN